MTSHIHTSPENLPSQFRLLSAGEVTRWGDRIWFRQPMIDQDGNERQGGWVFPKLGITVVPGMIVRRELDAVSRLGGLV